MSGSGSLKVGPEHQLIIVAKTGSVIDVWDVAVEVGAGNPSAKRGTNVRYKAIVASGWTDAVIPLK